MLWTGVLIRSDKSLVGKKAPVELIDIARLKLLKSLMPDKVNNTKIKLVKKI